ncbi:recombinase family protein [Lacticaseibacillus manihotivorans]|uniref:recombinase family protein n=1 Tax=Lacticaseibacillus manihotivorans TaxID=88233 RepID=UPI000A66CBBC|nr:recombinase family protein [Lacticaseibacillus manihotivorans]
MPENQLNKTFVEEYCPRLSPHPQWEQLIRRVKQGDTVVVANLFQLSRSIHESIEIIRWLVIHQVNLDVLNVGRLIEIGSDGELTPQSKSLINLYFAFEDFERTVIVDRAQSGKSSAKTRTKGYSDGRKPRL